MRRTLSVLAVSLMLIGVVAAPAAATVEREPVSLVMEPVALLDWGEYRETGQVIHTDGQVFLMRVEGHEWFDGWITVTISSSINAVTLKGTGHTTFEIASSNHPDSGWTGKSVIKYWDFDFNTGFGSSESHIVGFGYGDFEGMQLRGNDTNDLVLFVHNFEGEVKVLP